MNTKYVLSGVAALLGLISTSPASAQNLLDNGSFESGSASWHLPEWELGGSGVSTIEDGVFCVEVDSDAGPSWATVLKQDHLAFTAGDEYTLSFHAWASSPVSLPVDVYEDATFVLGTTVLVDAPLEGQPNLISFTAPAAADSAQAYLRFILGGGIVPAGTVLCLDEVALESAEVGSFLSFEDPERLWTAAQPSPSVSRVEGGQDGDYGLLVSGSGYVAVSSPVFDTTELDLVTSTLSVDVLLSSAQSNPWWLGDLSLLVSIPSAGIYNQWVGWAGFASLTPGAWGTVTFNVPPALVLALSGSHPDAQLHLAVNTGNAAGSTLLDNVRFTN